MSTKIDFRSLEEVWASLETESQPKELQVRLRDDEDKIWTFARAKVSRKEFSEGKPMKVFSRFGLEAGDVYVEVLEELEEPLS
jgi:NAD-dependent SIR2 family protein deacetylase|tara:strand:- start:199 stop:447 length:249 start_codon:yes stop_codon:yes gene_type:complete